MSSTYDPELSAVKQRHHCPAKRIGFAPIKETFRGETVWEGIVNIYALEGHAKAKQAYAWSFKDDKGETQYVVVSEIPPVKDALSAVRAYIASLGGK